MTSRQPAIQGVLYECSIQQRELQLLRFSRTLYTYMLYVKTRKKRFSGA